MIIKVLGIKHTAGEFTNNSGQVIKFDNYVFHHLVPNNDFMCGECYGTVKVAAKALDPFLKKVGYADHKFLLQKRLNLDYDQQGRLVDIQIIK